MSRPSPDLGSALPALALAPPQHGLANRWQAWATRQVASAGFRRWAARFWLTRPVARRRAAALFDLVAGFTYTQVLLACVRLNLFDRLSHSPATLAQLAAALDLPEEPCRRLLDAAVALRLLSRRSAAGRSGWARLWPGRAPAADDALAQDRQAVYRLGPLGAPMVGNAALAAMVEHHSLLYGDLADPLALLRGPPGQGALARYWAYARHPEAELLDSQRVAEYSALMAASQPLVADEVLDTYPLARHQCLMDLGGGEGGFAAAAARRWPHLKLVVFDLPAVAQRAHVRLAALGLQDRVRAVGGDFTHDRLPSGADIISLVRVVHDHDDDKVLALLRAARRALPEHGRLLLAEPMADTPGARAMGDAYFGLYLWAMGSGRPRTLAQLAALLAQAGFGPPRLLHNPLPLQTRVLVARVARLPQGMPAPRAG